MNHLEWLEERRKGIGGSEAAAALGLSRYCSPFQLYLEKTGEIVSETEKAVMTRGKRFEPVLREIYTERTGNRVETVPTFHSESVPFMFVSPDGFVPAGNRYLEIKTARNRHDWGEPGTDEIPQEYLIQVQHGLFVTNLQVADVFVAFSLDDVELYEVQADKELQEMIVEGERSFWKHVETLNPPELANYEDVISRYKRSSAKAITATPDILQKVISIKSIKGLLKTDEASEEAIKKDIMAFMGEHDTLLDADGKPLITWKSSKNTLKFNEEQFKAENPELYKKYLKESGGARRFLLKQIKGE